MPTLRDERIAVTSVADIVQVRRMTREWASQLGFSLVEQTKIVTAASELARNTIIYGGGGSARLEVLTDADRTGLRLTFQDHGPGIPDISLAMKDGYSSGNGLGLGLGGAKRLVNDFHITSQIGVGTTVSITRWRQR